MWKQKQLSPCFTLTSLKTTALNKREHITANLGDVLLEFLCCTLESVELPKEKVFNSFRAGTFLFQVGTFPLAVGRNNFLGKCIISSTTWPYLSNLFTSAVVSVFLSSLQNGMKLEKKQMSTERFTDLDKLNLSIVVRF